MDSDRFDRLARGFGQIRSRRHALRALAGVAAAGALALGRGEAAAALLNGGTRCRRDSQCKTGTCQANDTCSCSRAFPICKQPANRCKQATCDFATRRCKTSNREAGTACPDDGNPCTDNICDGNGACTHPNKQNGAACTTCLGSACSCQEGACTTECAEGSVDINNGCFRSESCGAGCGDRICGGGFKTCYCLETVGGVPACFDTGNFCTEFDACEADGDCPPGQACANVSCAGCGAGGPAAVCLAPCPVSP